MFFYNINLLTSLSLNNNPSSHSYVDNGSTQHLTCNLILQGISNIELRNKIFTYLNLKHSIYLNNFISLYNFNVIIRKFRDSGFFSYIKVSFISIKSKNNCIVHLSINPLLKKIKIVDLYALRIPKNYLFSLFKKQIGYPKSLKQIYSIVRKIQLWYAIRGYKWIYISVLDEHMNSGELTIKISEAKLEKIHVLCLGNNSQNEVDNKNFIIQELGSHTNQILSTRKIDSSISHLKEKKIISSCHYKVLKNQINNLDIIFTYCKLRDKETYIISGTKHIAKSLYKILHKNFYRFLQEGLAQQTYKKSRIKRGYLFSKLFDLQDLSTKIIYQVLQLKVFFETYCFKSSMFYSSHYFQLRHHIHNLYNNYISLLADIRFHVSYPKISICFLSPLFYVTKNRCYYLTIYFFQDIYRISGKFVPSLFKEFAHKNLLLEKSGILIQGIGLIISQNVFVNLRFSKMITINHSLYPYCLVYINNEWHKLKFLLSHFNPSHLCGASFKKSLKQLVKLTFRFTYATANPKNRLIPGQFAFLNLTYFKPILKYYEKVNFRKSYIQQLNFKYTQVVSLPLFFYSAKPNILIVQPEVMLYKSNHYLYFNNENRENLESNKMKIYSEPFFTSVSNVCKAHLEYHVPIQYNASIFSFITYLSNMCLYDLNSQFLLVETRLYRNSFHYYKVTLKSGIGLQVNLPIKQIPPIRLEYKFSKNKKLSFRVRLYSN